MSRFRIKISSSWFSEDFIVLRYSTNGIFWKSIKCCEEGILENWYYMVTMTSHFSNAEHLLKKFNTLEKVKQYEADEIAKLKKYNADIRERRSKHKENRNNVYKKYG